MVMDLMGRKPCALTDLQLEKLRVLVNDCGWTVRDVAVKYGYPVRACERVAREAGFTRSVGRPISSTYIKIKDDGSEEYWRVCASCGKGKKLISFPVSEHKPMGRGHTCNKCRR